MDALSLPLPPAGATSSQVFKRLSALLLVMAEVATATGTAHPPPLLRRLQVGCGLPLLLLQLALALLPGAAFVQSKRYNMTLRNSSACSNR